MDSVQEIPYKIIDRGQGDVAICYVDLTIANNEFG